MAVIALKIFEKVPVRFNLWIMLFTCCWVTFMLRVNMSVNIIAMVTNTHTNDNKTLNETVTVVKGLKQKEESVTFNWTESEQALILGSYFWLYPISSFIGGPVSERWGPRWVVLICVAASAFLTALSPMAARWHYGALIVIRFLLGGAGGFIFPALHVLVARWAPSTEKGKFTSALQGGTLGTVVTWSATGPLLARYGWPSAFYVPSVITVLWCILWWYIVADTPDEHSRISENEKNYIKNALGDKVKKTKNLPPFKNIAFSLPFLAMVVLHYGNLWGLYFIMTVGPKFVSSVLGFQLSAAGAVSALPYLARLVFAGIFGVIGDYILAKHLMNTTTIRKFFCTFSHVLPGILLIVLVYSPMTTTLAVALITLSTGFNGAATLTNLQNHQDLAPNFAGTLYGIANCIGSTAGFFTPMITAHYTQDGNGFEEWRPVFIIGGTVYIVSAIFFVIFGTGKTQSWNFISAHENGTSKTSDDKIKNDKGTPLSVISK